MALFTVKDGIPCRMICVAVKDGIPCRMALIAVRGGLQLFRASGSACLRCVCSVPAAGLLGYGSQFCIDPAHYFCVIDQLFI